MRDQAKTLKNHANPSPERRQPSAPHRNHILAEDRDETPAGPLRQIKHPQQRGLPGPRRAREETERSMVQHDIKNNEGCGGSDQAAAGTTETVNQKAKAR